MSFPRFFKIGGLAALFALSCCSSVDMHSFWASRYDPSRDCLEGMNVVDVLNGADPGVCGKLVCWREPGTSDVYLSEIMCDGPVGWSRYDAPGADSVCDLALAARARSDSGKCPAAVADGGTDSGTD